MTYRYHGLMEDPYIFAEQLDGQTLEYVKKQAFVFRNEYGNVPEELRRDIAKFSGTRRILQAEIRDNHIFKLFQEGTKYTVSVDNHTLYSTDNIVFWINADETGKRVALFETAGSDLGILKIFSEGKLVYELEDRISSITFTNSSFYLVKTFSDDSPPDGGDLNSHRVMKGDEVVFGEGFGSHDFIGICKSRDKVLLTVGDWNHTALFSGEIEDPGTWKMERDVDVPVKPLGIRDGKIIALEQRGNGVIMKGDSIIIEASNPIEDCTLVEDGILVIHLIDAKVLPILYNLEGEVVESFPVEQPMGLKFMGSDDRQAVLILESFGTPYCLYKYDNGKLQKFEENKVLDLEVKDCWTDGAEPKVHYFSAETRECDGKRTLAYGYGGFNISLTPMYSPLFAALLERGIQLTVSTLRGGAEYGEDWHRDGIREKKQNVFDDFISVLATLKESGSKVVAMGASNGGLLVGSILTQKPQLLDGAVIGNPVLDMVRFHLMSVGNFWVSEFGNPDDPQDFEFLKKYSPYHNITRKDYPPIFIYSRLKDDRVHPAHAIKFHMRLSEFTSNAYLRVNDGGGHIGIAPEDLREEFCENANFVLRCLE